MQPNPLPPAEQHGAASSSTGDRKYEIKAVGLLALATGLVGLDRFLINPLFPVMQKDLGLNYQDLGLIAAALAITWGIASVFSGRLSDRIGRKKVIVPSVVIFSLLVASSGLATGLFSLLMIRALMGLAEGAYMPAGIVAVVEASKPTRIGLNVGIQQMTMSMVGLGLGPVIAIGLLQVLPSWHWVFAVAAIPGLVLAFFLARVLRDAPAATAAVRRDPVPWGQVLRHRSVVTSTVLMSLFAASIITLTAFMPSYLTDLLHFSIEQMGFLLASLGIGGCTGMLMLPALSDRFGTKRVLVIALVIELFALWALLQSGANAAPIFAALLVVAFVNTGVMGIIIGPLTAAAVPAQLATTATGVAAGVAELVGGALAPAIAGGVAHRVGIAVIPYISLGAISVALLVVVLFLRPRAWTPPVPHTV